MSKRRSGAAWGDRALLFFMWALASLVPVMVIGAFVPLLDSETYKMIAVLAVQAPFLLFSLGALVYGIYCSVKLSKVPYRLPEDRDVD